MRTVIRYVGFIVLIAAAVGVWYALAPKVATHTPSLPTGTRYEGLIAQVLSDAELNNTTAQGAPQQSVVNGWVARDLLAIIAKENVDILQAQGAVVDATGNLSTTPFDDRVPALLLVGILAICWLGLTAGEGRRHEPVFAPALSPSLPVVPTPKVPMPEAPTPEPTVTDLR